MPEPATPHRPRLDDEVRLRLRGDLHDRLRQIARDREVSVSHLIREAIKAQPYASNLTPVS